jgi:hypothetical protein
MTTLPANGRALCASSLDKLHETHRQEQAKQGNAQQISASTLSIATGQSDLSIK